MTRTAAVALHGTTHVVRIATVRGAGRARPRPVVVEARRARPAHGWAAVFARWAGAPRRRLDPEQHALLVLRQAAGRDVARAAASGRSGLDEWALRGMLR